ncbi:hypothetical protein [Shouchella clausii]|uniref:Uncharacterized protein n=1 Tax=Shouchella clausii TaxID=79880 RepID=A0A268NYZ8_SHOCL|nr:hypothetical protein [Shouchella clausii]PAE88722.1 hypothetical protein CHH72_10100 [Shouchella clausii]
MTMSFIEEYTEKLSNYLCDLPPHARNNVTNEIRQHMQDLSSELEDSGYSKGEIAAELSNEFPTPQKLAGKYIEEYKSSNAELTEKMNGTTTYTLILLLGGLVAFIVPIYQSTVNLFALVPFLTSFVLGLVLINKKKHFIASKSFKQSRLMLCSIVGLGLAAFSLGLVMNDNFRIIFSLSVLFLFLISSLVSFVNIRIISKGN